MYQRPYSLEELRDNYPSLLKDPVHLWRAKTGIELIHKEPTPKEQKRIWENWNKMSKKMKVKSDKKSIELFGKNNAEHNQDL